MCNFTRNAFAEPGYYEDGQFGIRIENLVLVIEANTSVCQLPFRIITHAGCMAANVGRAFSRVCLSVFFHTPKGK